MLKNRIKQLRLATIVDGKPMTQTALAKKLGIKDYLCISKWERQVRNPGKRNMARLKKIGWTADMVLYEESSCEES